MAPELCQGFLPGYCLNMAAGEASFGMAAACRRSFGHEKRGSK